MFFEEEFNKCYNILNRNVGYGQFQESFLNYKYNTLNQNVQELLLNDVQNIVFYFHRFKLPSHVPKRGSLRGGWFCTISASSKGNSALSILVSCCSYTGLVYQQYILKESLQSNNSNLFYFGGYGSGIKVEKTTWPFVGGFAFCIWVQFEKIDYDKFNERNSFVQKLITVHAQDTGGLECYVIRGSVYYRVLPAVYQEPSIGNGAIHVGQLRNGMNFIGISHEIQRKFTSSSHLTLYFNAENAKTVTLDYPKVHSTTALQKFVICENLFGQVSCAIVMKESSSKMKTIQQLYGQAQIDYKQIRTLPSSLEKYFDRILSIYLPEFSDQGRIQDIMGNCNGQLLGRSGSVLADKQKFHLLGGFKLYNAMLQLCGTLYKNIGQGAKHLGVMIEILNDIMANSNSIQQEASTIQFFATFAAIIQNYQEGLIGQNCVDLLSETKNKLFDSKLIDQFFLFVLWNPKVQQKCLNEQIFSKFIQIGCSYITQNPNHFLQYLSFKDIMDILIFAYQDMQCCAQHYPDYTKSYQIPFFEKIMYLFNSVNDISENLLILDQYLVAKMPPCLVIQIFNIFKSLLIENGESQGIQTKQILQQWYSNNIINTLLFLFKVSPYYEIRAQVIMMINLVLAQGDYKLQHYEAIDFVVNSIDPLWENNKEADTPIIAKQQLDSDLNNLGTQFLNTDYESVPQAPSMTNRRKPNHAFFDSRDRQMVRAHSTQHQEVEKPKKPSFSVDNRGKKKFNIKIDTEAINSLYNYGGEKGRKQFFDDEAFQKELAEIHDLARQCVLHMEGKDSKQQQQQEKSLSPISPIRQQPQTTKNQQSQQKQGFKQYFNNINNELNPIKEVSSSMSMMQEMQNSSTAKKTLQSFSSTYNALLGWLVGKVRVVMMIEEGDVIQNGELLMGILKIFNYSSDEQLKAQIFQDLLCLTKSHQNNSSLILYQTKFVNEFLKILFNLDQRNLTFEIGQRLYITLISTSMRYDLAGADFFCALFRWGHQQHINVDQMIVLICDQVFESLKLYQVNLEQEIWSNILKSGIYLHKYYLNYPNGVKAYLRCANLLFKDCLIEKGTLENEMHAFSRILSQGEQKYQIILGMLKYQFLACDYYQVLIQIGDQETLDNMMLIYALSPDLKIEILHQMYSKLFLIGDITNITIRLLLITYVQQQKGISFMGLQQYFKQFYKGEFENDLDSQLANKFENIKDTFIPNLMFDYREYTINVLDPEGWEMKSGVNYNNLQKEIQLYGETKYIEIDERKSQWLQMWSERERVGKNKLHKQLNQVLTFNGWLAPSDFYSYSQKNEIINDQEEHFKKNPYFEMRQSKWLTKSWCRPFLKVVPKVERIYSIATSIQFGNVTSIIINDADKIESMGGQQLLKTALSMGRALGNNIRNTFKTILPSGQRNSASPQQDLKVYSEDTFKTKKIIMIKTLYFCSGFLSLTSDSIQFQYEYLKQDSSHASLTHFQLKDHQRLIKKWPINLIQSVFKKKYLQKKNAIEIHFMDGKSLFFVVVDYVDLEEIAQKLLRLRKTHRAPYFKQSKTTDPLKTIEKQGGFVQKWTKQQISNFKYLLYLNNMASRSYNDLTQYPVMPWVLMENAIPKQNARNTIQQAVKIYPDQQFRQMQRTMGALGNNQRIKSYLERFEGSDPTGEIPPFHFGSHYSSPAITSQYLIRIEPFTSAARVIQGGKFDISDRIFYSIQESFRCATEDVADVRELIPEVYCLPEMFLNLQGLNFGKTQTNIIVNNVYLPSWCHGNPWRYVAGMRNALESEEVQKNIPEWIDLIFGFRQRGKEADKALNKYFYLTYENLIVWDKLEEKNKLGIETQIVNFGITPLQLFSKPHLARQMDQEHKNVTHFQSELKVYRPPNKRKIPNNMSNFINIQQVQGRAIICIQWLSDVRLLCFRKDGKADFLKWTSQTEQPTPQTPPFQCGLEREKQLYVEKLQGDPFNVWDYSACYQKYPIVSLNQGKLLACGGYWQGNIVIISDNNQIYDQVHLHNCTVTAITKDKKDNYIISGDKIGQVVVWRVSQQDWRLSPKRQYFDHYAQINVITIQSKLRLFGTGCQEGYINLYNLYNGTFLRSFRHPNYNPINSILLSTQPLNVIIFFSSTDRQIYSYSINGFMLEVSQEECTSIMDAQIIRNCNFQDIMIYGNENGEIIMRALPYLEQFKKFPISQKSPVLALSHSRDRRFLLCGCNDGEISVMAESQMKS